MSELAVIFDMDGVLIDSVGLNWRAMNQVLGDDYGIHVDDTDIQSYLGKTLRDQVSQLNATYGVSIDYDSFLKATDTAKEELFASIRPKDGVVSLLQTLRGDNFPMGVGTSMPRDSTEQRLKTAGIFEYFEVIITEDDVMRHKPDPEVYLKTAESLGVDAAHCIVFEDAPNGLEAAERAGMKCVAVRTVYVPDTYLARANLVVSSLNDINIKQLYGLIR